MLDFDFDHAATTHTVHGSFPLPDLSDTEMQEFGWSRVGVRLVDGYESSVIGDTTNSFLDAEEGRCEYDVEWVNSEPIRGRLVTCYRIELGSYYRPRPMLWNCMDGAPTAGEHDLRFIDVRMIVPTGPRTRHPLHEPLEFEVFNGAGARPSLAIYRNEDLVWWIEGPADAASLVPRPESIARLYGNMNSA